MELFCCCFALNSFLLKVLHVISFETDMVFTSCAGSVPSIPHWSLGLALQYQLLSLVPLQESSETTLGVLEELVLINPTSTVHKSAGKRQHAPPWVWVSDVTTASPNT